MFRRIRNLKISLAAKCQLLFGAAVVLIIAAALGVPWQRMEQLTDQVNERFARGMADYARMDHAVRKLAERAAPPASRPATGEAPASMPSLGEGRLPPPKLVLLYPRQGQAKLTRFQERALKVFKAQPDTESYYRTDSPDGQPLFRYARPLYAEPACMACHAADLPPSAATLPATRDSTAARHGPILGLVSLEVPPQVETTEVLLNRIFILVAGLLAGTLAIIVFYLITTRLILQPVRVLQETAEKVSQGDLNIRSDISTGDEFQQLSETFNKMLANLKEGEDQLRAINKSLDLKLGQLAESNVALYESNRLKSEFLANVSHELRTPLNSILGFAELLRDGEAAADAKTARYAQNILSSGRNLLELINDLLDLAKIEAGRMEVRSEPLSLVDLFEGLTSILKPLSEKKNLTIAASVAPDVPLLQADPPKLQQVLYNFLSNAIKFSPAGGRVELKAERLEGESVRISVRDEGPGIPTDQQQTIFEKFRQLDGSVTREHGGTGLGLAISKELIGLLGGTIGVDSKPGEGATFWVTIPLKVEAGMQDLRGKLVLT